MTPSWFRGASLSYYLGRGPGVAGRLQSVCEPRHLEEIRGGFYTFIMRVSEESRNGGEGDGEE